MTDKEQWICTSSEYIHENPWYKLRHDKVIRPDGSQGDYYVVDKPGSVYLVAIKEDKILMVDQFRYTLGKRSLEVPAGGIDGDMDMFVTAQKELAEETGYAAKSWKKVGSFAHLNGYTNEMAHVYLATDLVPASGDFHKDESEFLTLVEKSWEEAWEMIRRGEIDCVGTITSLVFAAPHLGKHV